MELWEWQWVANIIACSAEIILLPPLLLFESLQSHPCSAVCRKIQIFLDFFWWFSESGISRHYTTFLLFVDGREGEVYIVARFSPLLIKQEAKHQT